MNMSKLRKSVKTIGMVSRWKKETNETTSMKRQIALACWDVARGTARMHISKRKLDDYMSLFEHLEETLGLSNIHEVLTEF